LPKAIVQGHGGILLEHLKYGTFHNDFKPGERCFWYTTTGWMMWNYIHGSLLAGATMVLYDGSPGYPDLNVLWKFAAQARIHHFGTSAGFILACIKAGIHPAELGDLSSLRSVSSTGSTLPPEGFEWIYRTVKHDLWLASMSGGTDVCSAFVGGNPTLPVYTGEIQCRALGCSLEAWSADGRPLLDEVGDMVITRPMPSMPVYFWNDPDFKRYTESYFEMYPGTWRHYLVVITMIIMIITLSITWHVPNSLSLHTLSIEVSTRVSSIIQNQTKAFTATLLKHSVA
jgi:acetoacetyl-CoA synthetase